MERSDIDVTISIKKESFKRLSKFAKRKDSSIRDMASAIIDVVLKHDLI